MSEIEVDLSWVKVDGRHRKDLGDIDSLASSIKKIGLINPITVTPEGRLVAGQRRMEAVRHIGMATIPARIVESLDDALSRLIAERDENTERKDMTPEEMVALGRELEELERPKAVARKAQAPGQPRGEKFSSVHANVSEDVDTAGETREKVARALGTSTTTYGRAKVVVEAANDDTAPAEEREVAQEALADMNATGNISGNYEKVRKTRDGRLGAPKRAPLQKVREQRKSLTNAVNALSGMAHGLALIDPIHPEITNEEAAQWVDGLSESRRVIESLIKRLRAHSQGGV